MKKRLSKLFDPPRRCTVLGYVDATTAPSGIIDRGDGVEEAARRAKEIGGDAIIVQSRSRQYAGTISSGGAFTSSSYNGNFYGTAMGGSVYGDIYGSGHANTSAWGMSVPMSRGKASVLVIKFK